MSFDNMYFRFTVYILFDIHKRLDDTGTDDDPIFLEHLRFRAPNGAKVGEGSEVEALTKAGYLFALILVASIRSAAGRLTVYHSLIMAPVKKCLGEMQHFRRVGFLNQEILESLGVDEARSVRAIIMLV
ncbi:hypothetical protein QBC46DRAFT_390781 [Diplogelasinospora grovesii]|uniref:Uncharacterized protein n=1 Tax=Diplogelasinospora grovesii TaxID=303347 RepID=A0AAN6N4C3_9PEZI|nr:hypothetical protein QBC46DRAFT_390781 [Diplogelasinospora grovesii]